MHIALHCLRFSSEVFCIFFLHVMFCFVSHFPCSLSCNSGSWIKLQQQQQWDLGPCSAKWDSQTVSCLFYISTLFLNGHSLVRLVVRFLRSFVADNECRGKFSLGREGNRESSSKSTRPPLFLRYWYVGACECVWRGLPLTLFFFFHCKNMCKCNGCVCVCFVNEH